MLAVGRCTWFARVPVLGVSRLSSDELVAFYRSRAPASLPYRATGATIEQLAQMFVEERNRYLVRGDVAFAQAILETAWFNFPVPELWGAIHSAPR
jgi:hypothetical protein